MLVAVASLAAVALAAPGTASAVQICFKVASPFGDTKCETEHAEKEYQEEIKSTSTNPVLTTSITNVTCEHSETTFDPGAATGSEIPGEIKALSFTGNCKTSNGTACTVQVLNLPYPSSIEGSVLTVNDASGAGFKVVCGFLINCTFTTTDGPVTLSHEAGVLRKIWHWFFGEKTGFCPASAELEATYTATSPPGVTIKP